MISSSKPCRFSAVTQNSRHGVCLIALKILLSVFLSVPLLLFLSWSNSKICTITRIYQVVPGRPVIVVEDPQQAAVARENRVPCHFTGSEIIKLLKPQIQVLDYCKVTRYSTILEDSV